MDNFSNETESDRQNSGKLRQSTEGGRQSLSATFRAQGAFGVSPDMCSQALLRRAPSLVSADPVCPRRAPTTAASACGTSSGTTSAKTSPKWRCPCSSTSRSTRCRGCVRSWSTASCSTGLPKRTTRLNVWWEGRFAVFCLTVFSGHMFAFGTHWQKAFGSSCCLKEFFFLIIY